MRGPLSNEDSLIARYFRPLTTDPGAFNLIDDAAVLKSLGDDLVVTTDAIVEGVHFLPNDPPDTIARKALRVNLSDLAAKGSIPAGFVLTLALHDMNDAWLAPFASALGEDAHTFRCPLLGGDTVSTPGPKMVSITAFGRVPTGEMIPRTKAEIGDSILITGTIGDAVLGLDALKNGKATAVLGTGSDFREALIERYRIPQPRVALASAIRRHAHAAMDISDGLTGDLIKLCAASGVSTQIQINAVPLSPAARAVLESGAVHMETILTGGDDYEILCAVPQNQLASFTVEARKIGVPVTEIGTVLAGTGEPAFLDAEGRAVSLQSPSYSHF